MIPDRTTQGRCHACAVRYVWPTRCGTLSTARCPRCGDYLYRTVHRSRLPTEHLPHHPTYHDDTTPPEPAPRSETT